VYYLLVVFTVAFGVLHVWICPWELRKTLSRG